MSYSILQIYIYPSLTCAADGNSLSVSGQRELGLLSKVLIIDKYISISQLFHIDLNVTFTPSGVTVVKGPVFISGRRKGGLYRLSCMIFCFVMWAGAQHL